eukprot:6567-Heterococcus_DN1.PRE.7
MYCSHTSVHHLYAKPWVLLLLYTSSTTSTAIAGSTATYPCSASLTYMSVQPSGSRVIRSSLSRYSVSSTMRGNLSKKRSLMRSTGTLKLSKRGLSRFKLDSEMPVFSTITSRLLAVRKTMHSTQMRLR